MKLGRFSRWFELTADEQLWAIVIVAIFLIGLVARCVHLTTGDVPPDAPGTTEQRSE